MSADVTHTTFATQHFEVLVAHAVAHGANETQARHLLIDADVYDVLEEYGMTRDREHWRITKDMREHDPQSMVKQIVGLTRATLRLLPQEAFSTTVVRDLRAALARADRVLGLER